MYQHILLPTGGSDRGARAISAGIDLAKRINAKVTGLYVIESTYIPGVDEDVPPRADAALSVIAKLAEAAGISADCVSILGDSTQNAIVNYAKEHHCDLIIMSTHGRSRVGKFFLGSTAASVLEDCDIPVMLYR